MGEVPINERLAVVEAQVASVSSAVLEIKDAVVGIRSTLEHVARIDERLVTVVEGHRELRRSLEAERENRQRADTTLDDRLAILERDAPLHSWRLDTAGHWLLYVGAGLVLMAAGYMLPSLGG